MPWCNIPGLAYGRVVRTCQGLDVKTKTFGTHETVFRWVGLRVYDVYDLYDLCKSYGISHDR